MIVSIWANDSFAYMAGSAFGRHKMAPRISPKKSWEGFVAGTLGTTGVWLAAALCRASISRLAGGSLIGLAASIAAVIGDLAESRIKREVGVKDSGTLLPGHGGFLDRFDSFIMVAIVTLLHAVRGGCPMSRLRVAILGSTGLDRPAGARCGRALPRPHRGRRARRALERALPRRAGAALRRDAHRARRRRRLPRQRSREFGAPWRSGAEALEALAGDGAADIVLNALVGAAGLRASDRRLRSGARLALANKESLVVGGELRHALGARTASCPVDSEHSAIFQCLVGEPADAVARIWLTASGGPFRGATPERARTRSPLEEALAHPRWTMGPKITIDSATLMNKGLEAIEAHHLFGVGVRPDHAWSCTRSRASTRWSSSPTAR